MSYKYATCPKCGNEDVLMPTVWGGIIPPRIQDFCGCKKEVHTLEVWEHLSGHSAKAEAQKQAEYDYWYKKRMEQLEADDN